MIAYITLQAYMFAYYEKLEGDLITIKRAYLYEWVHRL